MGRDKHTCTQPRITCGRARDGGESALRLWLSDAASKTPSLRLSTCARGGAPDYPYCPSSLTTTHISPSLRRPPSISLPRELLAVVLPTRAHIFALSLRASVRVCVCVCLGWGWVAGRQVGRGSYLLVQLVCLCWSCRARFLMFIFRFLFSLSPFCLSPRCVTSACAL